MLLVGDFAVENDPHRAEVLSSVPKYKWAVMCLMENICVLGKFRPGLSYSTTGWEFNVNRSTIPIKQDVFKQNHT